MTATATASSSVESKVEPRATPLELLPVTLVLGWVAMGLLPLGDPDVWWHLRTGELVVEQGFTTTDPWSWTSTEPWLLHEWLSEVIMYLSYKVGNYHGVIVLRALMLGVIGFMLVRACRRVSSPGITFLVCLLAFVAMFPFGGERPQLVSFALLAGMLPRLRTALERRRPPWELIPVVWLWANLHLLWSAMLVLYAALVLGLVLELGPRAWRRLVPFVAIGVISGAVTMLTPNGPALLLMPLGVGSAPQFITEFSPPSWHDPFTVAALVLLATVLVGWARRAETVSASEITFVLAVTFLGLSYARTVAVLVIAITPLTAETIQRWRGRTAPPVRLGKPEVAIAAALLVTYLALVAVWLPQVPGIKRGAPYASTQYLDDLPGRAKVINEYELGGWLLWAGRDSSPGVDGRAETKSLDFLSHYLSTLKLQGDWRRFIEGSGADAAWLRKESPLVDGLRSIGWRVAHRDDFTVVMLPPTAKVS